MSDKAKDWFQKNVFPTEDEVVFLVRGEMVDFYQIMQSYAEQHLEDVLGEVEKRLDEMTTDGETGLDWICGYQEALNLLKQRKG